MKMYKVNNQDYYILFGKAELRTLYLLDKALDMGIEFENNTPIRFMGNDIEEVDINKDDLFSYLYLEQGQLKEEIIYNDQEKEYLHSVRENNKPYSVVRRAKDIDYLLEDDYLNEKIVEKVKNNWNRIIENMDDKTIIKYFNEDKFKNEISNSMCISDELIKTDLDFDINKLETIIQDFDFNKEDDKLKALELLDIEIKENLDNFRMDIDIKELVKSNPDFFNLDNLIRGEEEVILEVFVELELEKDGHTVKLEVEKSEDITQAIIEELSKEAIVEADEPSTDNKEFTEEYKQRKKENDMNYRRSVENNFMEL